MAKINEGSFRDWNAGETVKARDYKQEREIIRVAVNDTHDRFLDEQANFQQLKDVVEENLPKIEAFEEIASEVEQKGNYALAQGDYAKGQGNAIQEALEKSVNIIKSPTIPEGIVEGRIWADTSDNTYQGTVFNELSTQLAQTPKYANIEAFGAIGDGVTDCTTAIQNAFDYALTHKISVWIPSGNFLAGKVILKTDIDGVGTLTFKNTGSKYDCLTVWTSGVTIKNITLNGNRVADGTGYDGYRGTVGLYIYADDVTVTNVKVRNTFYMGIYAEQSKRLKVMYCDVRNVKGDYGDGIFLTGCEDCQVLHNTIQDYTRIGIVTEGNQTIKSKNILIFGNWIVNGHSASVLEGGGEFNAGVWCENTNSATISQNTIKQNTHWGIRVVPLATGNKIDSYLISDNEIHDCATGIGWRGDALVEGNIINNSFYGVYKRGVTIVTDNSKHIVVDNCYFGNTTLNTLAEALIYVETAGTSISNVTIKGCKKGSTTLTNGAAELSFYQQPNNVNLVISDMIGNWQFQNWDTNNACTGAIQVVNTDITLNNRLGNFTNLIKFVNCKITLRANNTIMRLSANIEFVNCQIVPSVSSEFRELQLSGEFGNAMFDSCVFRNIRVNLFNAVNTSKSYFKSCEFFGYDQFGAILSNNGQLFIYEVRFERAGTVKPIRPYTSNPSRIELRNVFSNFDDPLESPLTSVVSVGVMKL